MSDDPEADAVRDINAAFATLRDDAARARLLQYAIARYNVADAVPPEPAIPVRNGGEGAGEEPPRQSGGQGVGLEAYSDIGELYDAANPRTDAQKALVVAYWLQVRGGRPDVGAQEVNDSLKQLGHAIGNITRAFGALGQSKPSLVRQTGMTGKGRRARKRYTVTREGTLTVVSMVRGNARPN